LKGRGKRKNEEGKKLEKATGVRKASWGIRKARDNNIDWSGPPAKNFKFTRRGENRCQEVKSDWVAHGTIEAASSKGQGALPSKKKKKPQEKAG